MKTGNRGQVLLVFLAALLCLLGLAALGVDMGYLYTVRHELQRSTDAGALAGASAMLSGDWEDAAIRVIAEARARDYASRDPVVTANLNPTAELQVGFPSRDRVRVDATRTVNIFFARLFLGPTRTVTAHSIAEASVVDRNVKGLAPWGIPYPWTDVDGDGIFDPGLDNVHTRCEAGIPDNVQFCNGTRFILKPGVSKSSKQYTGTPSIQQESGHYFALDFGASGGSGYKDGLLYGSNYPVSPGDEVPLETGALMGPTTQAIKTLVFDPVMGDPDSKWNDQTGLPYSDKYPSGFHPDGSPITDWMGSPRIVRIPVYDPSQGTPEMGKSTMTVAGFAGFWIEDIDNKGTITGRFVREVTVTGMGGPSAGPVSTPVLRNLRLVE
jgi:hypothetical protein